MVDISLGALARLVGGTLEGDPAVVVSGAESLDRARAKHVSFFVDAGPKNRRRFQASKAGCVFVIAGTKKPERVSALIVVQDPDEAFTRACEHLLPAPPSYPPGIHATAIVPGSAHVEPGVYLGPYVVLGEDVGIGEGSVIHAGCVIMTGCVIGRHCVLYPGCVLRERVRLGDSVKLQPGVVLGSDGFGYRLRNGRICAIPQLGIVELESEAEAGANATIDRARFGKTLIRQGSKLDNLVQIGHNVQIGSGVSIAAQTGIGGSTVIGDLCNISGQTGIANDVEIGAGSSLLARAGVEGDVEAGSELYGQPAQTGMAYMRYRATLAKLPELVRKVSRLEKELAALKEAATALGAQVETKKDSG